LPERFLSKDGNSIIVPDAFIPFGYGKAFIITYFVLTARIFGLLPFIEYINDTY